MRKAWRWGAIIASTLATSTAAVGVLHMPFAKSWLMKLGGCPLVSATPAQAEAARGSALVALRGADVAPQRPALGFKLEHTTARDVLAWGEQRGVDCHSTRDDTLVLCNDVDAAAIDQPGPRIQQLAFLFRARDGALLNVTTTRTGLTSEQSAELLESITARMRKDLGAPHVGGGERTANALGAPAKSFLAEYRFHDYLADTSAMNTGTQGVMVREHYIAVTD